MYICLCNGFTDREVCRTAAAAPGTIADIYRSLGARPECGKCVPYVRDLVRSVAQAAALTSHAGHA
jgi:bacterioferritin-associated ferredoxin